jgi:hypothetical protein
MTFTNQFLVGNRSQNGEPMISSRNMRHWALLGLDCENSHLESVFTTILPRFVMDWFANLKQLIPKQLIDCVLSIRPNYHRLVKA